MIWLTWRQFRAQSIVAAAALAATAVVLGLTGLRVARLYDSTGVARCSARKDCGPASANLSGNITGAGLVFSFTGAGSFNVDDFQITGTVIANPGGISVGANTLTSLTLNWTAGAGIQLQSTTSLNPPAAWANVPGTLGQATATITKTPNTKMFFRLISQ